MRHCPGYGLTIIDRKTDNVIGLVQSAVEGFPELSESLPPVLSDAVRDVTKSHVAAAGPERLVAVEQRQHGVHPGMLQPGDLLLAANPTVLKARPPDTFGDGETILDHPGELARLKSCHQCLAR